MSVKKENHYSRKAQFWKGKFFLKQHIFFFALLCGLIFLGSACTSNVEGSFQTIAESNSYIKYILSTDEYFEIDIDLENIQNLNDTSVLDDDFGKIILKTVESVSSDTIDLHFEAHGIINESQSTILTACACNEEFLQSQISVTPSESASVKYSLQTTEFDDFGNRFSISVFLPDLNSIPLKTISLTVSELLLVLWRK